LIPMTLYLCSGLTLVLLVGIVVGLENQLRANRWTCTQWVHKGWSSGIFRSVQTNTPCTSTTTAKNLNDAAGKRSPLITETVASITLNTEKWNAPLRDTLTSSSLLPTTFSHNLQFTDHDHHHPQAAPGSSGRTASTSTTSTQKTNSTTPAILTMQFTDEELDILYALTRQESRRLSEKFGYGTEATEGSQMDLVFKLDQKLSANKVSRYNAF